MSIFKSSSFEAGSEQVSAIRALSNSTSKTGVQKLLCMVTYLNKFILNISELTKTLRVLLKNGAVECAAEMKNNKKHVIFITIAQIIDLNNENEYILSRFL